MAAGLLIWDSNENSHSATDTHIIASAEIVFLSMCLIQCNLALKTTKNVGVPRLFWLQNWDGWSRVSLAVAWVLPCLVSLSHCQMEMVCAYRQLQLFWVYTQIFRTCCCNDFQSKFSFSLMDTWGHYHASHDNNTVLTELEYTACMPTPWRLSSNVLAVHGI